MYCIYFQVEFPSGFVYINGVFYEDLRNEDAKSYSEGIINWAKKHPEIGKTIVGRVKQTGGDNIKNLWFNFLFFRYSIPFFTLFRQFEQIS